MLAEWLGYGAWALLGTLAIVLFLIAAAEAEEEFCDRPARPPE